MVFATGTVALNIIYQPTYLIFMRVVFDDYFMSEPTMS